MSNRLFTLGLLLIFAVLFNFSITYMSGVYIVGDLGGSSIISSYSISFFGIGNALSLPLANYVRKRWGFKKVLLFIAAGFTLVTFSLSFIRFYPIFIFFRFLQGIAAGPPFIIVAALMLKIATDKQRERFMQLVLLSFLTAPILAASFSGVIAYLWSWRIGFFIDAFFLSCLFLALCRELSQFEEIYEPAFFDWTGYALYSTSILSLGIFIILGQELDWFRSPFLTFCFTIFCISIPIFVLRCCDHPNPVIPFFLCKNRKFSFSLILLALLFSSYFGIVNLLALWLSLDVNYTPAWIALTLSMMIIGALLFIHLLWKTQYRSSITILGIGMLLLAFSCFYSKKFNVEINFERIAIARLLAGFGFVMFLPPLVNIIFLSYPLKDRLEVMLCFQTTRTLSSSFGVSIYSTLWQRREAFYHDRLGEELTIFSPLTEIFFEKVKTFSASDGQSITLISKALDLQSRSLALADCLYLMGWIIVFLLLALIALRRLYDADYA